MREIQELTKQFNGQTFAVGANRMIDLSDPTIVRLGAEAKKIPQIKAVKFYQPGSWSSAYHKPGDLDVSVEEVSPSKWKIKALLFDY